jgi:hypothetical protein
MARSRVTGTHSQLLTATFEPGVVCQLVTSRQHGPPEQTAAELLTAIVYHTEGGDGAAVAAAADLGAAPWLTRLTSRSTILPSDTRFTVTIPVGDTSACVEHGVRG